MRYSRIGIAVTAQVHLHIAASELVIIDLNRDICAPGRRMEYNNQTLLHYVFTVDDI